MSRKRNSVPSSNTETSSNCNRQWVMIMQESHLQSRQDEDCRPVFCQLRHPKTGSPAMYMFSDGCRTINEIMSFKEEHRSWFIGNYVQSDGAMLVSTPMDPLFLALPYLIKSSQSGKHSPLDCVLEDAELPECKRLTSCISNEDLQSIATVKGSDDMCAFKYDRDKTLAWLKSKVDSLVAALQRHQVNVGGSAAVSTYVKSTKSAVSACEDDYIRYACGMISEYIQPELAKELREHLGVKQPAAADVNDNFSDRSPAKKKVKGDPLKPLEDYSLGNNTVTTKKPEKLTAAQKKLSKVDKSGMKSMSSFFTASSKK